MKASEGGTLLVLVSRLGPRASRHPPCFRMVACEDAFLGPFENLLEHWRLRSPVRHLGPEVIPKVVGRDRCCGDLGVRARHQEIPREPRLRTGLSRSFGALERDPRRVRKGF